MTTASTASNRQRNRVGPKLSEACHIFDHMFDRCPDPQLVADLIAAQAWPEADSAAAAAVELIDQAMAWERVAAWVESQRLDTLRRFEEARVAADSALASGVEASWAGRPPAERAALRRLKRGLETEAGRFAAEEIALGSTSRSPAPSNS
jgi:hypothetical protein